MCLDSPVQGVVLPVRAWTGPAPATSSAPLVITFHGAIDRSLRTLPVFDGAPLRTSLDGRAWLLAIADPSLERDPDLRIAWYAGHEGADVQAAIGRTAVGLAQMLGASRVIFAAGSTGAHAALLQAARIPGSVAVVQNPIARISGYYSGPVADYRRVCWPALAKGDDLSTCTVEDVATLYAQEHSSTAILLQNARDHHLYKQSLAFLAKVKPGRNRENLLWLSDYFDEHAGHSYPRDRWGAWVRAAVDAPSTDANAIAVAAQKLLTSSGQSVSSREEDRADADRRDLAWADDILNQALQRQTR